MGFEMVCGRLDWLVRGSDWFEGSDWFVNVVVNIVFALMGMVVVVVAVAVAVVVVVVVVVAVVAIVTHARPGPSHSALRSDGAHWLLSWSSVASTFHLALPVLLSMPFAFAARALLQHGAWGFWSLPSALLEVVLSARAAIPRSWHFERESLSNQTA